MKTFIQTLMVLFLAFLTSCTSNEGAMKKAALAAAESQFATVVEKEAKDSITQSDYLKEAFVAFMTKYSEFSVEDFKMEGENSAVATVYITSYTPDARKQMLKVAATVNESAARQFNFANAYHLISKQTGIPGEPMKYPFAVLTLKKGTNGEWSVLR